MGSPFGSIFVVVHRSECWRIAARAWQALQGAQRPQRKKLDISWCFEGSGDGAEHTLAALCTATALEELDVDIHGALSQLQMGGYNPLAVYEFSVPRDGD